MTLCTLAGFDNICLSQCQSFGFSHGSATRHWSICFIALTAWASDLMQCYIPGPQQVQTKNALTANAMSCHTMKLPFAHMSVFLQIHTIRNLPIFTRKLSSTRTSPTPAMFDPISCTGTCARALHVGGTSCRRNCLQGRAIFFILSRPHRAFGVSQCCRISD